MKNLLLLLSASLGMSLSAQPSEIKKQMSLGIQDGYVVKVNNAESKMIQRVWKQYSKSYGKVTKNKKADEEIILAANIPALGSIHKPDVYTKIEDGSMYIFFDMKGAFLNAKQYPKEHTAAMELLQEFGYEVERAMVKEELEKEEDQLKKLNKELEKLRKENISYHKDIEEAKEKIRKAEAAIEQNVIDQKTTEENIGKQTGVVQKVIEKLQSIGKK